MGGERGEEWGEERGESGGIDGWGRGRRIGSLGLRVDGSGRRGCRVRQSRSQVRAFRHQFSNPLLILPPFPFRNVCPPLLLSDCPLQRVVAAREGLEGGVELGEVRVEVRMVCDGEGGMQEGGGDR